MPVTGSQDRLIAIAALISAGVITMSELERPGEMPTAGQWIGLGTAFTFMAALSDLGIPVGGGLALLFMVTVILLRGDRALAWLNLRGLAGQGDKRHESRKPQKPRQRQRGKARA